MGISVERRGACVLENRSGEEEVEEKIQLLHHGPDK